MKSKRKINLLYYIIIFTFIFGLIIPNVFASDKNNTNSKSNVEEIECSSAWTDEQLIKKYGITTSSEDNEDDNKKIKYTIKMTPSKEATNTTIVFTAKVKKGTIDGDNKLGKNDSIVVWTDGNGELDLSLTANASAKNKELQLDNKKCKGTITINVNTSTTKEKADYYKDKALDTSKKNTFDNVKGKREPLDCSGNVTDEIEQLICSARNALSKKNNLVNDNNNSYKFGTVKLNKTYKCNINDFKDVTTLTESKKFFAKDSDYRAEIKNDNSKYYYRNREYAYGWEEKNETATYTYNYDPGKAPTTVTDSCKIKCEEGVAVEYGPPIGSKAGLCFEYKVRVTSAVRCYMSSEPKGPDDKYNYCTPSPVCTGIGRSGTQYFVRQGGPNEEYDKCIKSCDGGKYTKTCSNKCYKKVYGSDTSKTINNREDYSTLKLDDGIAACKKLNPDGCYYTSGGTIKWSAGNSNAGRWYNEGSGRNPGSAYTAFKDGFYRHNYGNGNYCQDTCWWQMEECSKTKTNYYLNPNIAQSDYDANVNEYNKLLERCQAAASCSKKTAEFTISVDYTNSNNKKITIDFPYSTGKDTIPTNANTTETASNNDDSTIINDPEPQGCYKKGSNKNGFYQVAWSFPGSWINNKTGEVSYKKKTSGSGWRELPDKFCIPLDAQNVNQLWWNTYFANLLKKVPENSATSYENECVGGSKKGTIYDPFDTIDEKNITYNIHGKTKNFGYFGWNINVSCFYALNTDIPYTKSSTESSYKLQCSTSSESRVRTVDLTNLFPSTDGSEKIDDVSATGRTPGFNWSTYATISENKNAGYTSYPAKYLADVQKLGYSVYSNDYLDYEITLDKDKLVELKKYSNSVSGESGSTKNDKNYTVFDGTSTVSDKTGVTRYTSKLLGSLGSSIKRPSATARECNNMKNYGSDECQKAGEIKK